MKHLMLGALALLACTGAADAADPVTIPVTLAPGSAPSSGRLLIFATRVERGAPAQQNVDTSPFEPTSTAVAGREVESFAPGQTATLDGETDSFPTAFSQLPPGTYRFQAVLDRNHDYNYGGRGGGDIVSDVVEARLPGRVPALVLTRTLPEVTTAQMMLRLPEAERASMQAAVQQIREVDFISPKLSAFWGRPIHMRGWVALPPGYANGRARYPVIYATGGFGSNMMSAQGVAAQAVRRMANGDYPPMIWVSLDESSATGTHEFADSANNGPWGAALTTELIPALDRQYRTDARANGRFLTGHSSGGWATLWLQTRYPAVFGGTWSTSPDPSDFHNFTNVDLYAPDGNFYRNAAGEALPLVRDQGRVIASVEQFARMEAVLGAYGGQMASFEWVFSPKGPDGRPQPLFDRRTGAIDAAVAAYWRDHYDVAARVTREWPRIGRDLAGKVHVIVGTADTFYLDGPARRLEAAMQRLGARAHFTYLPGKTHFDLFQTPSDRLGLMRQITREMYAVTRPGQSWPNAH